jgi:hypothetical protein
MGKRHVDAAFEGDPDAALIPYVAIATGFVYLAAIPDAWSRRRFSHVSPLTSYLARLYPPL